MTGRLDNLAVEQFKIEQAEKAAETRGEARGEARGEKKKAIAIASLPVKSAKN